jgi:hypothetical protein
MSHQCAKHFEPEPSLVVQRAIDIEDYALYVFPLYLGS